MNRTIQTSALTNTVKRFSYNLHLFKRQKEHRARYHQAGSIPEGDTKQETHMRSLHNMRPYSFWDFLQHEFFQMRATRYMQLDNIEKRKHRTSDVFTSLCLLYPFLMQQGILPQAADVMLIQMGLMQTASKTAIKRIVHKCRDPNVSEYDFKEIFYGNDKIKQYFHDSTTYIVDQDCEYNKNTFHPLYEKLKWLKYFNTDDYSTTGYYKLNDVHTGAEATVKFATMNASEYRYMISRPFDFCDMRAEISVNGEQFEVQLVDPSKYPYHHVPLMSTGSVGKEYVQN